MYMALHFYVWLEANLVPQGEMEGLLWDDAKPQSFQKEIFAQKVASRGLITPLARSTNNVAIAVCTQKAKISAYM